MSYIIYNCNIVIQWFKIVYTVPILQDDIHGNWCGRHEGQLTLVSL